MKDDEWESLPRGARRGMASRYTMEMILKIGTKMRKLTVAGEANGDCVIYQSATNTVSPLTLSIILIPFFAGGKNLPTAAMPRVPSARTCLLYTSDAADDGPPV